MPRASAERRESLVDFGFVVGGVDAGYYPALSRSVECQCLIETNSPAPLPRQAWDELTGMPFGDLALRFPDAIPIGLRSAETGEITLKVSVCRRE